MYQEFPYSAGISFFFQSGETFCAFPAPRFRRHPRCRAGARALPLCGAAPTFLCPPRGLPSGRTAKKSRQKKAAHTANSCSNQRTSTAPTHKKVHQQVGAAHQRFMARIGGVSPLSLLTFFAAAKKVSPAPDRGIACAPAQNRGCQRNRKNNHKKSAAAQQKAQIQHPRREAHTKR